MNIPTADSFISMGNYETTVNSQYDSFHHEEACKAMIDFAKLHVIAALKAVHKNQQLPKEDLEFTLNAYPLINIK